MSNEMPQEVQDTIELVSGRFGKYTFGNYDKDDIKQEAAIFCLEVLDKYDGRGPLEHFLMAHVRNRLINLRRNKSNNTTDKFIVNYPVSIQNIDEELEPNMKYNDKVFDKLTYEETMEQVNNAVPIERRMDLIKLLNGAKVSKSRKLAIQTYLEDIL